MPNACYMAQLVIFHVISEFSITLVMQTEKDRRTDRWTDGQSESSMPPSPSVGGIITQEIPSTGSVLCATGDHWLLVSSLHNAGNKTLVLNAEPNTCELIRNSDPPPRLTSPKNNFFTSIFLTDQPMGMIYLVPAEHLDMNVIEIGPVYRISSHISCNFKVNL